VFINSGGLGMKIKKIFGFVVPIGKGLDNVEDSKIQGSEILSTNKLFQKLTQLFNQSEKDCDISIGFIPKEDKQKNDVRDLVVNLCNEFTLENCKPLVKSLIYLTDNKIKEGLLFFVYADDNKDNKILITRYPSEEAIRVKKEKGECVFEVIGDVYLKNSKKYKAVYYQKTIEDYWSGYAVDKQINDDNMKEISNYWIKDFLQSQLGLNTIRGSEMLAKAVKKTIDETTDDKIREELIGVTTLVKNTDSKTMTFNNFFDKMNLSKRAKDEVMQKVNNSVLWNSSFKFDSTIFSKNCHYLYKILDNGAIAIAPAENFPTVWHEEVAKNGKVKLSTVGKKIRTRVKNNI
jgi:hypothetical protein